MKSPSPDSSGNPFVTGFTASVRSARVAQKIGTDSGK